PWCGRKVAVTLSERLSKTLRWINRIFREGERCHSWPAPNRVRGQAPRRARRNEDLGISRARLRGANAGEELPDAAFEIDGGRGQALGQHEDVTNHGQAVAGRVLHRPDVLRGSLGVARGRLDRFRNLV